MAGLPAGLCCEFRTYESVDLDRLKRHILESVRHDCFVREVGTGAGMGRKRWSSLLSKSKMTPVQRRQDSPTS